MKDTCNYPDGTFIGIITDIQTVEKPYPSVTVTAALAVDGKIAKHQKCFNKPFTNGREAFQNFCEEFDLFSDRTEHRNDYVLELDYVIGTSCTAVLSSDRGFESITPLGDTDLKIAFGLTTATRRSAGFSRKPTALRKIWQILLRRSGNSVCS